jgi:hypothetical protein
MWKTREQLALAKWYSIKVLSTAADLTTFHCEMAFFTRDEEAIIQQYPLGPSLDVVRSYFKSRDEESSDGTHPDQRVGSFETAREAIAKLLSTIQGHPVARKLRPASLRRSLDVEISFFYGRIMSEDFHLSLFTPLTVAVADDSTDLSIWQSVVQLIADISGLTTPPRKTIQPSYNGTPFTRSSASYQTLEQSWSDLQTPLRIELSGCTFENVDGFWAKYFEEKEWSDEVNKINTKLLDKHKGDTLHGFPDVHSEEEIWNWLSSFQDLYLSSSPGRYFRTIDKTEITGGQGERQLDILLKSRTLAAEAHKWHDVSVVGELTISEKSKRWMDKFIQLATYVRDIFSAQPTRRFVHGL